MIDLLLNEDIYSEQAIISAINVYSQLAIILYQKEGAVFKLSFQNCIYDKQMTIMEFENYLIGIENSL